MRPDIDYIAENLQAAVSDQTLNQIFVQYFEKGKHVAANAKQPLLLPYPWKSDMGEPELRGIIDSLHKMDPDFPSNDSDLQNFAYLFVLPPGTILHGPDNLPPPAQNSLEGLGGYHAWYQMQIGDKVSRVYFAVVAWADGQNGAAVPRWAPCESVCGALYHELAEIRLNPNVDDMDTCNWGWLTDSGQEICDLVIEAVCPNIAAAFRKQTIPSQPRPVPIQLLWSNCGGLNGKGSIWDPSGAPPNCKCLNC